MALWCLLQPYDLADIHNTAGRTYRQKLHILSERIDKALDALIPSCTGITDVGALVRLRMMKIYRRSATRAFLICSVGDEGESSLDDYVTAHTCNLQAGLTSASL